MSETFGCDDKDRLVEYLYGELDGDGCREVERHMRSCHACAAELAGLQAVRQDLQAWMPPETHLDITVGRHAAAGVPPQRWAALTALPAWAQVAAAVLVLAAGAALANLQVRYDRDGLAVTTGWMAPASPVPSASPAPAAAADWRPALTALERDLRTELAQVTRRETPAPVADRESPPADTAAILRRVQAMLEDSEQRQRQELAVRMLQLNRDIEMRRRADLVNINQSFGALTGRTYKAEAGQQEVVNYLRRVAAQPIP